MEIQTVHLAQMSYQFCYLRKIFKAPKLIERFESSLSITLGIFLPLSQQEMKSKVRRGGVGLSTQKVPLLQYHSSKRHCQMGLRGNILKMCFVK